jgi:hypothetical protein
MNWGTHAAEFTQETEALLRSSKLTLTKAKDGAKTFPSARNGRDFVENATLAKGAGAAAKLANRFNNCKDPFRFLVVRLHVAHQFRCA